MNSAARSVFVRSLPARFGIVKEHVAGRIRRRHNGGTSTAKDPDGANVRRFFETLSSRQGFGSVTDGGKSWYLSCFAGSAPVTNLLAKPTPLRVLDVGCSRAALLQWLRQRRGNRPMSYLGTDLDQVAVERCREAFGDDDADFRVEDISHPTLPDGERFDLVFCVNVFPYVTEPRPVVDTLLARLTPGRGLLILMDPVPSPYWNTAFGGFRILQREPEELAALLSDAGAKQVDSATLYGLSVFGRGLLPLAAMGVWRDSDA